MECALVSLGQTEYDKDLIFIPLKLQLFGEMLDRLESFRLEKQSGRLERRVPAKRNKELWFQGKKYYDCKQSESGASRIAIKPFTSFFYFINFNKNYRFDSWLKCNILNAANG